MSLSELLQQFVTDMAHTTWYEYLAVFAGIAVYYVILFVLAVMGLIEWMKKAKTTNT